MSNSDFRFLDNKSLIRRLKRASHFSSSSNSVGSSSLLSIDCNPSRNFSVNWLCFKYLFSKFFDEFQDNQLFRTRNLSNFSSSTTCFTLFFIKSDSRSFCTIIKFLYKRV
uniref:Uncharacterized protein n=1 Tax=Coscinodiscus wailesii TaxID=671091 RepID=A0A7T8G4Q8_9STRA|nr:hypothetical protein K4Z92_mgp09 [Coscinodiscus wailesii]QQP21863.1 hypothetical protein [Coscinodiscus wailesii]